MNPELRWNIRAATAEDAPALAGFHRDCWRDAYRGIVPDHVLAGMDLGERTARWRRRLVEGHRSTAVATPAGTAGLVGLLGLVSWGPSHDPAEPGLPPLELASLYVARDEWGSGLGAALIHHALADAPAHLWVFTANGRARAFYEKHGFVPDGHEQVDDRTGVFECRYVRR